MGLPVIDLGQAARWAFELGEILAEKTRKSIPIFEDEVVVEVQGQPGSSKQQLYYLALTTAFGIVRNRAGGLLTLNPFIPPVVGILQIEYDAAENWVECRLAYSHGTLSILQGGGLSDYANLAVYNGPQCEVVGGQFNFVDGGLVKFLPGIPNSAFAKGLPVLPFEGRTILTNCPSVADPVPNPVTNPPVSSSPRAGSSVIIPTPNPKPPGDNRSRGRVVGQAEGPVTPYLPGEVQLDKCCPQTLNLVPLVIAALTDPGSLGKEMYEGPTTGPLGS